MNKEGGQAVLQLLTTIPLVISIALTTSVIVYLVFSQFSIKRAVHNGLICLAQKRNSELCRNNIISDVQSILPLTKINQLSLVSDNNNYKCQISWINFNRIKQHKTFTLSDDIIIQKIEDL